MTKEQQKLVESNIKLAYKFATQYKNSYTCEFDDLVQIASVGLCKAAITYDPSKNYKFSTYAYVTMRNEILQLKRKKRIEDNYATLSLDSESYSDTTNNTVGTLSDIIPSEMNIEDQVVNKFQIEYALNQLKEPQKSIVKYMIDNPDATQCQCRNHFGVSQPTVSRAISKFKQMYNK